ncbi:hypothetical protein [Lentzea sp. NPDC055074]
MSTDSAARILDAVLTLSRHECAKRAADVGVIQNGMWRTGQLWPVSWPGPPTSRNGTINPCQPDCACSPPSPP